MRILFCVLLISAAGCKEDETVAGYGAADKTWVLTELDGAPFTARADLHFPESGKISGQAPCNQFSGSMTVPYPWFEMDQVIATRMACPDLPEEQRYFEALSAMTVSEVLGDTMLLSNQDGREMVFKAGD